MIPYEERDELGVNSKEIYGKLDLVSSETSIKDRYRDEKTREPENDNYKNQDISVICNKRKAKFSKDKEYYKINTIDCDNKTCKRQPIKWSNIAAILVVHIVSLYAFFAFVTKINVLTVIWVIIMLVFSAFGVTGGAHRLWTHRAYKAKLPLQIILLLCYSAAGQNTIYEWVRDHRVHHKFSETDADPHNSKRGFFFSHVGWLMQKKHPDVLHKGKLIDMSDITEDPLIAFHTKYFIVFKLLLCFIIPSIIPVYIWSEYWVYAFLSQTFVRYTIALNATWSVNSFAHIWGNRPYDKNIMPAENIGVAVFALGEGWHNYHHVFPWDYKTAELGDYKLNLTTMLIDMFAKIGWAYDLKTASPELILKTVTNQGDGTRLKLRQTI